VREPDQFTLIFDRYFPQVHSYVARRLGSDLADDLSSETFLIAFRQRDRFDNRTGAVRAWLYGIATNLIRRHRRDEVRAWRAAAKLPSPTAATGHEDRIAAQVTAQGVGRLGEPGPAGRGGGAGTGRGNHRRILPRPCGVTTRVRGRPRQGGVHAGGATD
jgi:hypothetical protein